MWEGKREGGRPEGLRRKKSEAKVSGKREQKKEQIMQPGAAVAALDVREGDRSEEERKEDRGRKRGEIKAISRKEGGDSVKVGFEERLAGLLVESIESRAGLIV